jgi:hypothetical protein
MLWNTLNQQDLDGKVGLMPLFVNILQSILNKKKRKYLIIGVADGARTHDNRNHNPAQDFNNYKGFRLILW